MGTAPPDLWEQIGLAGRAPICVFDHDFRLIAFNQAHNDEFFRVNGYYTRIGDVFPDLFVPEQASMMRSLMKRALTGERFSVVEEFGNPALGNPCWEISYAPIRDAAGAVVAAFHLAVDVGPRFRAEAAITTNQSLEQQVAAGIKDLQESRARLRTIFETSFGFQGLLTKNGVLIDANATSLEAVGLPLKAVVGSPFWETPWFSGTPGMSEQVREATLLVAQGAVIRQEIEVELPVGGRRWFDFAMRPIRDDAGEIMALVAEAIETTDRRRTEEALRQAQKMESVGQLTGGVAHDFNNLLTVIRGSIDLLQRPGVSEERRQRYLAAISETSERATRLTAQLLAFSRRQALTPEVFDAGASLKTVAEMIRTLSGPGIEIVVEAPEAPAWVNADSSQFDTSIINMAINARDAMNGEGRLTVSVAAVDGLPAIRERAPVDGDFVAVSIADTGVGILQANLAHIFEPFFTTKTVGKGTGLGLSQVFGFSRQSGGEILVESEVGAGTTFTLFLPQVASPQAEAAESETAPLADGRGLSVLVVEDNPEVGNFAVDALTQLGCETVLAADGPAALAELEKDAGRFNLVFSDVIMPGMTGIELGEEIRRLYQELPVVLTSGYSQALAQHGASGFDLVHKPYSVEQLSRTLQKAARSQPSVG